MSYSTGRDLNIKVLRQVMATSPTIDDDMHAPPRTSLSRRLIAD